MTQIFVLNPGFQRPALVDTVGPSFLSSGTFGCQRKPDPNLEMSIATHWRRSCPETNHGRIEAISSKALTGNHYMIVVAFVCFSKIVRIAS